MQGKIDFRTRLVGRPSRPLSGMFTGKRLPGFCEILKTHRRVYPARGEYIQCACCGRYAGDWITACDMTAKAFSPEAFACVECIGRSTFEQLPFRPEAALAA